MRMFRLRAGVLGLALIGLVSGCGGLDATDAFPALNSSSPSAPSSTVPDAPSLPSSSSSATSSAAPSPAAVPAPAVLAPASVYHGSGSVDLAVTKPAGSTAVIATISGNAARRNFDVRALDGAQDRLVATTAPYSGSTLLDVAGTTTHRLRVHAVGAWTITLADVRSAHVFSLAYQGTGDTVLRGGAGGRVLVRAQGAGTPFLIRTYGSRGVSDLVRETGPWAGTIELPRGGVIVTIRAVGPWSFSIDSR